MTDEDNAFIVYTNARLAAEKYRECVHATPAMRPDEFATALRASGYVSFTATRVEHPTRPDVHSIWVIMGSQIGGVSEFRKILDHIGIRDNCNIILVSKDHLGHFMRSEIAGIHNSGRGVVIEDRRSSIFMFEVPKHVANCKHEIIAPGELEEYLTRTYSDANFKKILYSDPQIAWIGARPGDVIKISVASFSAGVAIDYRICVD